MRTFLLALLFLSLAAHADRTVTTRIIGTDSTCGSFSPSTSGSDVVLTCVPSSSPGAPTGCNAAVNSSTALVLTSAGGAANLAVTCVSPTTGITYNWSKNNVSGASTAASWTDTLPSNGSPNVDNTYTYSVRACLGVNCATVPASPLVATVRSTGGGGSFTGTCPGFTTTTVLAMSWSSPVRLFAPTFGANDVVVVSFTTGNIASSNNLPHLVAVEYLDPPNSRTAVLSATACDFGAQAAPGAISVGNTATMLFAIAPGSGFSFYPVLAKNTVYYMNIKNNGCAASCGISVDLLKGAL